MATLDLPPGAPGLTSRRFGVLAVCCALLAGVPSLLWALDGATFVHDDWSFATAQRWTPPWDAWWSRAFDHPGRPGAATWSILTFEVLGLHPALHVGALALLNAALGVMAAAAAWQALGPRAGAWVGLAYAALPNRGSWRHWIAAAPYVVAMVLVLGGILALNRGHRAAAGALFALGVITNEGTVGLVGAAGLLWLWSHRSDAGLARALLVIGGPPAAAAIAMFLGSSKRDTGGEIAWFSEVDRVLPANLGVGVFGSGPVATTAMVAVMVAAVLGVASRLPSYRRFARPELDLVVAGLALLGVVSLPLVLVGWPFATDGIFDRANGITGVGTAVVLGGLLALVAGHRRPLRGALAAVGVAGLAALTMVDLSDYRQAGADGAVLLERLDADLPVTACPVLVTPELPNRGGVSQFIAYGDVGNALRIIRDDRRYQIRMLLPGEDPLSAPEPLRYDWAERELRTEPTSVPCPDG